MNFVLGTLSKGRRIKVLAMVDGFIKESVESVESVDMAAGRGMTGQQAVRVLQRGGVTAMRAGRTVRWVA